MQPFHYVDRICALEPNKHIKALKFIRPEDELFYLTPEGHRCVSPAIISECLAQAASWLIIKSQDFKFRPVYLSDDFSKFRWHAKEGDCVVLEVEVTNIDEEVWTVSAEASVDGKTIATSKCSRSYLMPIEDFDQIDLVRKQFNNLYRPGAEAPKNDLPPLRRCPKPEPLKFVDGIIEHNDRFSITTYKNFTTCEPYFATHFRFRPVVPGVLLMSALGESCQYLTRDPLSSVRRTSGLYPVFVKDVRFRKFVTPGDRLTIKTMVTRGDPKASGDLCVVSAQMTANRSRVWQGKMGLRVVTSDCDRGTATNALETFIPEGDYA